MLGRIKLFSVNSRKANAYNPPKQNEIYNYIRNRYPKEEIIKSGLKDIDTRIENNNLFLILYDA
ncbi:MAG: hypothetical protein JSV88_14160 [Candidatus Aminicenantes bacterium]|nr:MAG: hypothetical protein JSV88_14160 [Candidatus Aminicenantes bacterium]